MGDERCGHIRGGTYAGRKCFGILDGATDAYEWSFVAVPAQINAGVTKSFEKQKDVMPREEAVAKINRALMLKNPDGTAKKLFDCVKDSLGDKELEELCVSFSVAAVTGNCDEYKM